MTRFVRFAIAGNVVFMAILVGGLFVARQSALATFDSPAAQRDWQTWRDAAGASKEKTSPVERRVPKSKQPPSLVLLRDYFATCVITSVVLSSALYWTFVLFIRGVACGPKFEFGQDESRKPK